MRAAAGRRPQVALRLAPGFPSRCPLAGQPDDGLGSKAWIPGGPGLYAAYTVAVHGWLSNEAAAKTLAARGARGGMIPWKRSCSASGAAEGAREHRATVDDGWMGSETFLFVQNNTGKTWYARRYQNFSWPKIA